MYLNNNEDSQLFTGKSLRLGGSKELYKENGTVFGDLSAILIDNMPFWAEFSSTPSSKVSLMSDWEFKMQAIVNETIHENVTSLAGVPSWMLVLLNNVLESTQKQSLFEIWPNLECLFSWRRKLLHHTKTNMKRFYQILISSIMRSIMLRKAFSLYKIKMIPASYY